MNVRDPHGQEMNSCFWVDHKTRGRRGAVTATAGIEEAVSVKEIKGGMGVKKNPCIQNPEIKKG